MEPSPARPAVSLIIPVFNKWELTRNCLRSIAATASLPVEVIVVDNASTDVTGEACPFLGKALFSSAFQFIRNDQNRNFAGACNQGARAAHGEYLLFLNNDTEPQKNWLEPLLQDFTDFQNLAATGPLLTYPQESIFGRLIQHLGVLVSPFLKFGHLYQGIPKASPLAKKRRFFQAITAACMVMPKSLFLQAGGFDENFINGFEDVDLCGRLRDKGLRFTVNPDAEVIHLESQTPGRKNNENQNFSLLTEKSLKFFRPDFEALVNADGLDLLVTDWFFFQVAPKPEVMLKLDENRLNGDWREIREALLENIFWQKGWQSLLELTQEPAEKLELCKNCFTLFKTVPIAAQYLKLAREVGDKAGCGQASAWLRLCCEKPEEMLKRALASAEWCQKIGLTGLATQYESWVENYDEFKNNLYPEYQREYFSLLKPA